ncbi:AIPR family protein [Saccharopolyspora gregorii]|uniref:Abortive phage infection protein C-terminal domain-containing protein n=1 Tax=Saccharopolyspora gregorii TaxID=33914 RepID=A0ABP6RMY6_9PSEU
MTVPIPIARIKAFLHEEFGSAVDMHDLDKRPEHERTQSFTSRALAALAVRHLAGFDRDQAAETVIDGCDDYGIDAVAVDDENKHLWLVQAKWSDKGKAGIDEGAAHKLLRGLRLILNNELDLFNDRFQVFADDVREVVGAYSGKITLVLAAAGDAPLSPSVQKIFDDQCDELNLGQKIVDYIRLGAGEFHDIVRRGVAAPEVDIDVLMERGSHLEDPYRAWYGSVPAEVVASWYEEHREQLFSKNIRHSLGVTKINQSLVSTLLAAPEKFWYFNNGITVLCATMERSSRFRGMQGGPVDIRALDASVVNGAQTVASVFAAVQESPERAAEARVLVRLISLENCEPGFAAEITRATNTQNRVVEQDFIALKEEQDRLEGDFLLDLRKKYVVKRGAEAPVPENGCSVGEAALALACAHPDPRYAMRAKRDLELLWEEASYSALFPANIQALKVWRAVLVHRAVIAEIAAGSNKREGRAELLASHGDLIISHLVSRRLGTAALSGSDAEFEAESRKIPGLVADVFALLMRQVDEVTGRRSAISGVFKDDQLCRDVVKAVMNDLDSGKQIPALLDEYLPVTRRPGRRNANAVMLIIDSMALGDGTPLHFEAVTGPERVNMAEWIREDPRRSRATWVNHRSKPLLWEADGGQYSPSGLVKHMLDQVPGKKVKAVQGTTRWKVPGQGTLKDIADKVQLDQAE